MKHRILVSRQTRGLGLPAAARLIKKAARAALRAEGMDVPCEISIILTNDREIQLLNRDYRDVDSPTDVLSFPLNEKNPKTGGVMLGDIAVSLPRCISQGKEYGHGSKRELQYLTVHSVLHLLGYDHTDEAEEKRQMRQREEIIMKTL